MSNETYNGWSNYETWLITLHIDNDQGLLEMVCDLVRDGEFESDMAAGEAIRDWLDDLREEMGVCTEQGMWSDMLRAAFEAVDWREVGEKFRDYVKECAA